MWCKGCGQMASGKYCGGCGKVLIPSHYKCHKCGKLQFLLNKFCEDCGQFVVLHIKEKVIEADKVNEK